MKWIEGFAGGDEIELAPEERLGFRVTKRGGNVGVQFFWKGDQRRCEEDLEPQVRALGGWLDGGPMPETRFKFVQELLKKDHLVALVLANRRVILKR